MRPRAAGICASAAHLGHVLGHHGQPLGKAVHFGFANGQLGGHVIDKDAEIASSARNLDVHAIDREHLEHEQDVADMMAQILGLDGHPPQIGITAAQGLRHPLNNLGRLPQIAQGLLATLGSSA
jgi:hypothetical protein